MNKLAIILEVINIILKIMATGKSKNEAAVTSAAAVNLPVEEILKIVQKYLK